jgi:hypothetical protein
MATHRVQVDPISVAPIHLEVDVTVHDESAPAEPAAAPAAAPTARRR